MHITHIKISKFRGIELIESDLPVCTSLGVNIRNLFLCGSGGIGKTSFLQAISLALLGGKSYYYKPRHIGKDKFDSYVLVRNGSLKDISKVIAYSYNRQLAFTDTITLNDCRIENLFSAGKTPLFDIFSLLTRMVHICNANEKSHLIDEFANFKSVDAVRKFCAGVRLGFSLCLGAELYEKIPNYQYTWQTTLQGIESKTSKGEYDCLALVSDIFYQLILIRKKDKILIDTDFHTKKAVILIDNVDSFMSRKNVKTMIEGLNSFFPNVQFIFGFSENPIPKISSFNESLYLCIDKKCPFLVLGSTYYNQLQQ